MKLLLKNDDVANLMILDITNRISEKQYKKLFWSHKFYTDMISKGLVSRYEKYRYHFKSVVCKNVKNKEGYNAGLLERHILSEEEAI